MYMLIDRINPEGHVRWVPEIQDEYILEYMAGKIDIIDPRKLIKWVGNLECPGWEPIDPDV